MYLSSPLRRPRSEHFFPPKLPGGSKFSKPRAGLPLMLPFLGEKRFKAADRSDIPADGSVAEWSKAAVLKTAVGKLTRGSNPFASAKNPPEKSGGFFFGRLLLGMTVFGDDGLARWR